MRDVWQLIVTFLLSAALFACGGGTNDTSGGTAATGHFIDAAVAGLTYTTSSGATGTTGPNGEFTYNPGESVTFSLGAITLGTVTPNGTVTPIHFAPAGSNNTTPQVVAMVQFLMSISTTDPTTGAMVISDAARAAAANATPIDFAAATQNALATAVGQVVPGASLVTPATAQQHLAASLNTLFSGTYSGQYGGASSGTWTLTIDASGQVSGSTGTGAAISGTMSTALNSNGFSFNGTCNGATWQGTLDGAGNFTGAWSNGASSGGYSGKRTGNLPANPPFSGTPLQGGQWKGVDANGRTADMLVAPGGTGTAWVTINDNFMERPSMLIHGVVSASGSAVKATGLMYNLQPASLPSPATQGSWPGSTSGNSLLLQGFTFSPVAGYDVPATLTPVVRNWAGSWNSPGGADYIYMSVAADGTFMSTDVTYANAATTMTGRQFTGTLSPSAVSKNYYDLTLTFAANSTLLAGKTLTGVAYLGTYTNPNTNVTVPKLIFVATDGTDWVGWNVQ